MIAHFKLYNNTNYIFLIYLLYFFISLGTKIFGSYRVDLLVFIYPRIIDIHNFEIVLKELNGYECGCFMARIGPLNVFNPLKPDGAWELNLSCKEERIMAKCFCQLAVVEPGDNWSAGQFRWEREMDPMPGWELTQGWMSESGMPQKGILNLTYYSGGRQELKGCKPAETFRRSLLCLVLVDEREIYSNETIKMGKNDEGEPQQPSLIYLLENKEGIINYILQTTPSK
jgi:hypothetical protein